MFALGRARSLVTMSLVTVLHAGVFWGIRSGFDTPAADVVEPPQATLIQLVDLTPPTPTPVQPEQKPQRAESKPAAPTPPQHVPVTAPAVVQTLAAFSPPTIQPITYDPTPPAAAAAPSAPDEPDVRLPSTDADYGQSCRVAYPPMSRHMHEHGRVTLSVLVGGDGRSKRVQVLRSSGSPRLDGAAQDAMKRCRFRPGTVNGVAREMAYEAPVDFVLQ